MSISDTVDSRNSFRHLQRVLAYVLRFINSEKGRRKRQEHRQLSSTELDHALVVIMKSIQKPAFNEEVKQLQRCGKVSGASSLSELNPFMDENDLIRVGGRLENDNLSFEAKHPIILPYNDSYACLLLEMLHKDHMHCGSNTLIAITRQKFWPIKIKTMARAVLHKCVQCVKAKPVLYKLLMGNLPDERIQPCRPFSNTGVDFCGPFHVHYKVRGKVYIAVFCCFAT